MEKKKFIIHMDMDAFYAAVEVLDNPKLKGLPVIVGGSLGQRGVVSTASYEARAYGVGSAMPMFKARRLCPNGVYLEVRPWRYLEISKKIMNIFKDFTPIVEPLSLDEAFLDITGSIKLFGSPEDIAISIKKRVKNETGLTVTAGLASKKYLAKIASSMNKPDGLTIVKPEQEKDFLWALPISQLWGVGKVMENKLLSYGIEYIGDIAKMPNDFFIKRFGERGQMIWSLANLIDDREVIAEQIPKSMGAEKTYAHNLETIDEVLEQLLALSFKVAVRLRNAKMLGRTITITLRAPDFKTINKSYSLKKGVNSQQIIYKIAKDLCCCEFKKLNKLRLLGITLSNLEFDSKENISTGLFDNEIRNEKKNKNLNEAIDLILNKFGHDKIKPATLINNKKKP